MDNIINNLPEDKQKIIEALIKKIKSEYKNDIAVVVCYGSYITGTAYQKSDLDFFFIPKTERGYKMNMQFIVDGIGYDFWPLSWERAEKIAKFEEDTVSIIAEGVLVYYDKLEDIKKFNSLKQRIKEITTYTYNKNILINKAEKLLSQAKSIYFDLKYLSKEYENVDSNCSKILNLLIRITTLLNSTYIKKGVYNIENEIKDYYVLPKGFLDHVNSAIKSKSISDKKSIIKKMIINVDELLHKEKFQPETEITREKFKGFYEEIKSNYNKLIHACENKDYLKAYFTAHLIESEVKGMIQTKYKEYNFPNLIINIDENNFEKLKELTNKHEEELIKFLQYYEIDIQEYINIDTFIKSI